MFRKKYRKRVLIVLALGGFLFVNFYLLNGCKKVEIERLVGVVTQPASNVSITQAWLNGNIIDVGANEEVSDYGFCWARIAIPTLLDDSYSFGSRNYTGTYYYSVSGLASNTEYVVRAYVKDGSEVFYGDTIKFRTDYGGESLPSVTTSLVYGVTNVSANVEGNVTHDGNSPVITRGVCWSTYTYPTITDYYISSGSGLGTFTCQISSLIPETTYYVRAYATNSLGTAYGSQLNFTTLSGLPPGGEWLHYDNGANSDNGIGLTDGGNFDVAIRIPSQDLVPYTGFNITKIKFFPRVGNPIIYSVTIWEGYNPPTLEYIEEVPFPTINGWTEFILSDGYYITANTDIWIGYWIQDQPANLFPAGVDSGPAYTGFGDMISMDDGDTWDALSELNEELDFNWNLQAYVTNEKGEEVPIIKRPAIKRQPSDYLPEGNIVSQIASQRIK